MMPAVETRASDGRTGSVPGRRRVVLFGASNLTRALPLVAAELHRSRPSPIELISVHGHGRSYGLASSVLARELPSILDCGVWRALQESEPCPTDALLTDIGNDIMYGAGVETIAGWIEECLARLAAHGARIALARLPLPSLERLSRARFELARSIFFPTRRIAFDAALVRARELDLCLPELARAHRAALIEQAPDWYGVDPIHIRRGAREQAWTTLLASWDPERAAVRPRGSTRPSLSDRIALARCRPAARRLFGFEQRARQPSAILSDGTTLALY